MTSRLYDSDNSLTPITNDEIQSKLQDHTIWLESQKTQGVRANFQLRKFPDNADLSEANLPEANMAGASLIGVDLFQANLSGAKLLSANLSGANLLSANLSWAKLLSANLSGAKLQIVNLSGADLRKANLSGADLFEADLSGAKLLNANMAGADLHKANLSGADLLEADLSSANLHDANLSGANFRAANLTGANLSSANMTGAKLRSANLTNADLREAVGVRLSANLIRDAHFSLVSSRYQALLRNHLFPVLRRYSERRGWAWLAQQLNFRARPSDPWSVLRQLYAGPQMFFLLLFLVLFAVPYVGRAIWWGAVAGVEPRLMHAAEIEAAELREKLEKVSTELSESQQSLQEAMYQSQRLEAVASVVSRTGIQIPVDEYRAVERRLQLIQKLAQSIVEQLQRRLDQLEQIKQSKMQRRRVLSVILRWDRGWLPTFLAVLLMLHHVMVYNLITRVGALRDQEERSGYSPGWTTYLPLIWIHCLVTVLFYVSFASLIWNIVELLYTTVYIPNAVLG